MVARAILDEMRFGAAARRERPVSSHIPYTRHVDDQTLRTKEGHLVTVLALDGFCFETADTRDGGVRRWSEVYFSRYAAWRQGQAER